MNLLPKSSREFGSVDYWERFFQQRGKRAFEWYGSYLELCGVLHKYIKPREKVSAAWRPACVLGNVRTESFNPALGGSDRPDLTIAHGAHVFRRKGRFEMLPDLLPQPILEFVISLEG